MMSDDNIFLLLWGIDLVLAISFLVLSFKVSLPWKKWLFGSLGVLLLVPLPIVKCDTIFVPGWMLLVLMACQACFR